MLAVFVIIFIPLALSAHEVYVLTPEEISLALQGEPLNFLAVISEQRYEFFSAALLGVSILLIIFLISISRKLEMILDPLFFRLKPYTSHISYFTLVASLFASAHYGALFGVELPLMDVFHPFEQIVTVLIYAISIFLLINFTPRIMGLAVLGLFIVPFIYRGFYMLNYGTYFGEALIIFLFSGNLPWGLKEPHLGDRFFVWTNKLRPYKFLILRIFFGSSLIYASFYAKFLHGTLALETVQKYNLTNYFPFDPFFLILGAFIIEILIGLFFIIGFEIRFTSIFFLFFLILSVIFFKEQVWPHIILIGTAIAMFVHGYDRYTVERAFFKKDLREPVL